MLDITASSESREITYKTVECIAGQVFIPLTVGGGVRNTEDIKRLLRSGADKVSINTAAVENPDFIKEASDKFGSQCIVAAIDAKQRNVNERITWEVFTHGGRKATGLSLLDWAREIVEKGAGEILLTSMDRDGTKEGFDIEMLEMINNEIPVPLIASGGAGNSKHMVEGALLGGADALLAASVFHFGELTVSDVKKELLEAGLIVRGA